MTTVNLQLSDDLKSFAERRAAEMGFASAADYLQSLVAREAEKREALSRLQAEVIEGIESGEAIEVTDDYLSQKLARLQQQLRQQTKYEPPLPDPAARRQ